MSAAELVQEYNALPPHLQEEVADFIAFLKQKVSSGASDSQQRRGLHREQFDKSEELDGPITGYEAYIMDWSL